ncbi:hypothetical protein LTR93_004377 [Exophiala xenobiotica]|nr:hypothetical protein LTR93_004377 [Exophiala xenobiotica]
MFETEHGRWQAVQTRSKSADSAFVYAVTTTRIFCRPTCPARLARRANVKFYDTSIKAIAGGFRPCKRCKPDQVHLEGSVITKPQKEIVKRACDYVIKTNGNTTLKEIAQNVGISARYLHGIFKDMTGLTPAVYAARIKSEGLEGGSSEATSQEQSPQSFGIITNSSLCETDWATGQYGHSDILQADADTNLDFYTSVASYEAAEEQLRSLETQNDLLWNSGDQPSVRPPPSPLLGPPLSIAKHTLPPRKATPNPPQVSAHRPPSLAIARMKAVSSRSELQTSLKIRRLAAAAEPVSQKSEGWDEEGDAPGKKDPSKPAEQKRKEIEKEGQTPLDPADK